MPVELGINIDFRQSSFEGEIIEAIHAARQLGCGDHHQSGRLHVHVNRYSRCA